MASDSGQPRTRSLGEKILAAFALVGGVPTRANEVPLNTTVPDGLVHVHAAPSEAEAELVRQKLADAGFHVEFVPATVTGSDVCVHVHANEAEEAIAFLEAMAAEQSASGDGSGS